MVDVGPTQDGCDAHQLMQAGLLRSFFWLSTVACLGLVLRVTVMGGPEFSAAVALVSSTLVLIWSYRPKAPVSALGLSLCIAFTLLIGIGALDLDGAGGPALSLSFIPGLLAMLMIGAREGFFVTALMLSIMAALFFVAPASVKYDQLRFQDAVAMTLFSTGLSYTLVRSLLSCEASIRESKETLQRVDRKRQELTNIIYEQLEPLSLKLKQAIAGNVGSPERASVQATLGHMLEKLGLSKTLSQMESPIVRLNTDEDLVIRRRVMHVWLTLGAVFMLIVVVRNFLSHAPFIPSLFSLGFCFFMDFWLRHIKTSRQLEWAALSIGLLATGPLGVLIYMYGATMDAPPLVIMPSIVLFTALLSQGPAAWVIVAIQVSILAWLTLGTDLSLGQSRLAGNLVLGFVVIVVALHNVLGLRRRYAQTLTAQSVALQRAQRQHRALAGTLFHDVSNHLQSLIFHLECEDDPEMDQHARSLSRRIARLIALSKDLLLDRAPVAPPLTSVTLAELTDSLREVYDPRLSSKRLDLTLGPGLDLAVMAQPELLVESVLGNLLSNAIKFSPQGSLITLRAQAVESCVRVTLSDTGPGVPREVLAQLGKEGQVPSQIGTAGEEGQGYGLQLVQEHVERMGGRLELHLRPQGGTDAVVWLAAG